MITLDFSPRVFLCRTHSYILARRGNKYGHFLTMHHGSIELVKVPIDEEGGYVVQKRNEGETAEKSDYVSYPLNPYHKTSLESALRVYQNSTLDISVKAKRALDQLLGVSPAPLWDKAMVRPVEPSSSGGYTLQDLCNKLKLDPQRVRASLRKSGIQKPGPKWEWANEEEALRWVEKIQ